MILGSGPAIHHLCIHIALTPRFCLQGLPKKLPTVIYNKILQNIKYFLARNISWDIFFLFLIKVLHLTFSFSNPFTRFLQLRHKYCVRGENSVLILLLTIKMSRITSKYLSKFFLKPGWVVRISTFPLWEEKMMRWISMWNELGTREAL